jgi:hypothetical protein
MQNMFSEPTPVQRAVKRVVGTFVMPRREIKVRLKGMFSEAEIDEAIDTVLSQIRVKIIRG